MTRRSRLKGLDEMPVPNPRDRHRPRADTVGQYLKAAATTVAIAYGLAGAVVLTALLARVGPSPIMTFMGESVAAAWLWFARFAGLGT